MIELKWETENRIQLTEVQMRPRGSLVVRLFFVIIVAVFWSQWEFQKKPNVTPTHCWGIGGQFPQLAGLEWRCVTYWSTHALDNMRKCLQCCNETINSTHLLLGRLFSCCFGPRPVMSPIKNSPVARLPEGLWLISDSAQQERWWFAYHTQTYRQSYFSLLFSLRLVSHHWINL